MAFYQSHAERDPGGTKPFTFRAGGITIPDRVYSAGDTIAIALFGGTNHDRAFDLTFVGHEEDTLYPVFCTDNYPGSSGSSRELILTDQPPPESETVGSLYTPGAIVTDGPLDVCIIRFASVGSRGASGFFGLEGEPTAIPDRVYRVGDIIPFGYAGRFFAAEFVGYEEGTRYPLFRSLFHGSSDTYILTNEVDGNGNPFAGLYPEVNGDAVEPVIIHDTWPPKGIVEVTFSNFGTRTGSGDGGGDFTLQGEEIRFDQGAREVGDAVTLRSSGGVHRTTFFGHERDTGNPVFQEGDRQIIATNAERGDSSYTSSEIICQSESG